jgi:glucose/arabinose dehydrogenase
MYRLPLLSLLSASLLLAADAKLKPPALPAPYHTPSAKNGAKVIPQPAGSTLQLPKGFVAEEFASGFQKPRYMLQLSNGTVLVADSVPKGSVIGIDARGNKQPWLQNLERPSGLALHDGYLYVADALAIRRYKLDEAAARLGAAEEIMNLKGYEKGHWARSLAFDAKGQLYVAIGSGSNVDAGDPPSRAAVTVCQPDGSNPKIFAGGLRNPVRIRFHPTSKKLWAAVQERDELGDDLVPDFFTEVAPDGFYGWPYAYIGPNEEPRRKGENPTLVQKTLVPTVLLQPHAAVMDAVFYTGSQFPARYKNGAFLSYRGSNNRAQRLGYSIVFQPFRSGKPAGPLEDFLTGFMKGPDDKEVWGRPVGLLQMNDGSLLLSEDGNNRIWRIRYQK